MIWSQLDTWIVIVAAMCGAACGLLGCFLVLRRVSMMGDAISHAVLPGLAIAFLVTGTRAGVPMFIGAAVVGVLTALFTQWIHRFGQVEQSAAMGVVFSVLFAIGLILIVNAADSVDLDPGCVLYGSLEFVPLNTTSVAGYDIPVAAVSLGSILLLNVLFVVLFFKELKLSSFDGSLATTLGINATLMHYLLMTFVAVTTVASFEAVGSILVIAMLIVPAAVAYLLTERLSVMLLLSVVIAAVGAAVGHVAAITIPPLFGYDDTTTSGMMAVVLGLFFVIAMLVAPRQGILSRLARQAQLSLRIIREDVLGMIYRLEEADRLDQSSRVAELLSQATGTNRLYTWLAMRQLRRSGLVLARADRYELSPDGKHEAMHLVRSHRMWELYLQQHLNLPEDKVHFGAHRMEHFMADGIDQAVDDELRSTSEAGQVSVDPHGKQIPKNPDETEHNHDKR